MTRPVAASMAKGSHRRYVILDSLVALGDHDEPVLKLLVVV